MAANKIKTISLKETINFIRTIQIGEAYKIVEKQQEAYADKPFISTSLKYGWVLAEVNQIILIVDNKPTCAFLPTSKFYNNDDWYSFFIKILYKDQICFICAAFLEKI